MLILTTDSMAAPFALTKPLTVPLAVVRYLKLLFLDLALIILPGGGGRGGYGGGGGGYRGNSGGGYQGGGGYGGMFLTMTPRSDL